MKCLPLGILTVLMLASRVMAFGGEVPAGQNPAEEYQKLVREYERDFWDYHDAFGEAETDEEREKIRATFPRPIYQDRFMELAREYPRDPATIDALTWVLENPWYGPQADKNYGEALDILLRDFVREERIENACGVLAYPFASKEGAGGFHPDAERLLRAVLKESPHHRVRGMACFSLACYLRSHAGWRSGGMSSQEAGVMAEEAEGRYEQVAEDFAEIELGDGRTLGEMAEAELFEIRNLIPGKRAPEIEGEDIAGTPMRLSDYRGKVVVLSFWGTWCGPCMALVPHEQSLVERLEGKPFALLGIDSDEDRDHSRRVMEERRMTWRSWWDGPIGGPIVSKWNITSWPTIYVLDAQGVIRYINVRGEELDEAVEKLLGELEADESHGEERTER